MDFPEPKPDRSVQLPVIVLASASPRRREMLTNAGIEHTVHPAEVDDGDLVPGESVNADQWVVSLAYLKATSTSRMIIDEGVDGHIVIIGADTVCVQDGQIIGQPTDREHARQIIDQMQDATHEVLTGVAMLDPSSGRRVLFVDRSVVTVGPIPEDEIELYLESGNWKGKAGAYNITERREAGWPITFSGDESSIVGLPLARVVDRLSTFELD